MLYRFQIRTCICMTLIFSALESDLDEAENLIHVTTMQLSNDLSHMHHNCHMLPSVAMAIFLQLILSDCQMLFWVAHEEIIMTLKSTDMTKFLTGTRKIHCSVQPVPLFIQGCQPIC